MSIRYSIFVILCIVYRYCQKCVEGHERHISINFENTQLLWWLDTFYDFRQTSVPRGWDSVIFVNWTSRCVIWMNTMISVAVALNSAQYAVSLSCLRTRSDMTTPAVPFLLRRTPSLAVDCKQSIALATGPSNFRITELNRIMNDTTISGMGCSKMNKKPPSRNGQNNESRTRRNGNIPAMTRNTLTRSNGAGCSLSKVSNNRKTINSKEYKSAISSSSSRSIWCRLGPLAGHALGYWSAGWPSWVFCFWWLQYDGRWLWQRQVSLFSTHWSMV